MQIDHKKDTNSGLFYLTAGGQQVAEMTYRIQDGNTMIIDHTEVDESLRGQSIGLQLVQAGVAYARSNNYTVIPLCPFAKKVFDKHAADYKDVAAT